MDRVWIWTEYGLDMKGLDHFISLIVNDSWRARNQEMGHCILRNKDLLHLAIFQIGQTESDDQVI